MLHIYKYVLDAMCVYIHCFLTVMVNPFIQISVCDVCQRVNRKLSTKTPQLHPIKVKSPWYHVGIDFVGPIKPISCGGNRYILTLSDYFTKFVEAVPLPDKSAPGVARALFKVFIA